VNVERERLGQPLVRVLPGAYEPMEGAP
jgi:hypothetical protein